VYFSFYIPDFERFVLSGTWPEGLRIFLFACVRKQITTISRFACGILVSCLKAGGRIYCSGTHEEFPLCNKPLIFESWLISAQHKIHMGLHVMCPIFLSDFNQD
jgi:hypothetical protein